MKKFRMVFVCFKKVFLSIVLICVIALTGYFSWKLQQEEKETIIDHSYIPDLTMNTFNLTQYDAFGRRVYLLIGDTFTYFKVNTDTMITQPQLQHFINEGEKIDKVDWHATSVKGFLNQDQTKLTLKEDVNFFKDNERTGELLHIKTSLLYIFDKGERIETDQTVTIKESPSYLTGVGMIGFPKKDEFTLLKEVKTHYAPPNATP